MKLTVFAHNGGVTAIAFPGEATNYNGSAVATIEVKEGQSAQEALEAAGYGAGVGSAHPPAEAAKPAAKAKRT